MPVAPEIFPISQATFSVRNPKQLLSRLPESNRRDVHYEKHDHPALIPLASRETRPSRIIRPVLTFEGELTELGDVQVV